MPSAVPGATLSAGVVIYMKQSMKRSIDPQDNEPVGIVISRGWEPETVPRFSAYVWAPGPEDEIEEDVQTV